MWISVVVSSAVLVLVFGADAPPYAVPEPQFEVYDPKGVRAHIPDCVDVESVQFVLGFNNPVRAGDQGDVSDQAEELGGYWILWSPDTILSEGDVIYYRLVVKVRGVFWPREGQYVVRTVTPLADKKPYIEDCDDQVQGQYPAAVASAHDLEERQLGRISAGKKSAYKSSYSSYKASDVKPITRSSTSTTSGTFYIKPSGVVEASGYKSLSSYDSTRRDGEQWQHHESQLSAQEIEDLKRLHGQGIGALSGFSGLSSQSGYFPGGARRAESSYFETQNSDSHPGQFQEGLSGSQRYHQSYFTKESSSTSQTKPLPLQQTFAQEQIPSAATRYESYYTQQSRKPLPRVHGSVIQSSEFERTEKTVPEVPRANFEFTREESHKVISNQGARPVYPVQDIEIGKNTQAFNAGNLQTVERSGFQTSQHYTGSIFTSNRVVRPTTPQECSLIPDIDFKPSGDIREIEKSVNRLTCLASLAESSLREELRLVKQQNSELIRKFDLLELEVNRLGEDCNCSERAH